MLVVVHPDTRPAGFRSAPCAYIILALAATWGMFSWKKAEEAKANGARPLKASQGTMPGSKASHLAKPASDRQNIDVYCSGKYGTSHGKGREGQKST